MTLKSRVIGEIVAMGAVVSNADYQRLTFGNCSGLLWVGSWLGTFLGATGKRHRHLERWLVAHQSL